MTPSSIAPAALGSADIKILRISEDASTSPTGQRTVTVRVDFNVGQHGPFTERFDKATFDAFQVNGALNAFAQKIANIGTR